MDKNVISFINKIISLRKDVTIQTLINEKNAFYDISNHLLGKKIYSKEAKFYKSNFKHIDESADISDTLWNLWHELYYGVSTAMGEKDYILVISRTAPLILYAIEEYINRNFKDIEAPIIRFGKNKGKRANEVSVKWLKWWHKECSKIDNYYNLSANRDLYDWIEGNIDSV